METRWEPSHHPPSLLIRIADDPPRTRCRIWPVLSPGSLSNTPLSLTGRLTPQQCNWAFPMQKVFARTIPILRNARV
jgi:hypothetical protein